MELCIFLEPQQGATYGQQLRVAQKTEQLGFDGLFRSDHLLRIGEGDGLPGPTESWLTLAALARETSRIRLGTLMTSATFRHPGVLAVSVAQVDEMSGGRVELGIGAGWYEAEHASFGLPFPSVGERFDQLEEQIQIITGLWDADGPFDFSGSHYRLRNNPALPRPVQRPYPPLIIGGFGPRRTPRVAARFASEYNMFSPTAEEFEERVANAHAACREAGRDPKSLRLSVVQTLACGRDEDAARSRAERIGRGLEDLRAKDAGGTPPEIVERMKGWARKGVARVYLQLLDIDDIDQVELVGSEVLPAVTG
jgi:F420-dependent oxidoreductase-like protein